MKKVMVVIFGLTLSVSAQINNVSLLGAWAIGQCDHAAIDGNYAYVASGFGITVVDISNRSNPFAITQIITNSGISRIVYHDEKIFVANSMAGFSIFNVSEPLSPVLVGNVGTIGSVIDIFLKNDYAFLADTYAGLRIIDVSNPELPSEVGSYNTSDYIRGVFVEDTLAFIALGDEGINIIDIKEPSNPTLVGEFNTPGQSNKLQVKDAYLYIADGIGSVRVLDITTPSMPQEINYFITNGMASDIIIEDSLAFVADGNGFYILDISDPVSINQISHSIIGTISLVSNDDYVFISSIGDRYGLSIFDINDLFNPVEVAFYCTGPNGSIRAVSVKDNFVYIAEDHGFRIIDIHNNSKPTAISYYAFFGSSRDIFIKGDYAYIGLDSGFRIFDISNPYQPVETTFYFTEGVACSNIKVIQNIAYISVQYRGLKIFDVTNPYQPEEIGSLNNDNTNRGLFITSDEAYFGISYSSTTEIEIVDISNFDSLKILGSYFALGTINNLVGKDDLLYTAHLQRGMEIIDISNPALPINVGVFDTEGSVKEIILRDNYAYLADHSGGVKILNLDNPVLPFEEGIYSAGFFVEDLDVQENIIYAVGYGLYVLKNDLITSQELTNEDIRDFRLFQNYPNPFNPSTKIRFTIPEAGFVQLTIYDILGNEIETIIDEYKKDGTYEIDFRTEYLPSGIYFYRIICGSYSDTKKMILLR